MDFLIENTTFGVAPFQQNAVKPAQSAYFEMLFYRTDYLCATG